MNKNKKLGMLGAGFAMALASLGALEAKPAYNNNQTQTVSQDQQKQRARAPQAKANHRIVRENLGGLDLVRVGKYGMSPKEYGLRYGNGKSRNSKTNFNRLYRNAKIGRRA